MKNRIENVNEMRCDADKDLGQIAVGWCIFIAILRSTRTGWTVSSSVFHVYMHNNNEIGMVFNSFEASFVYKTIHRQNKQSPQTEWATNDCIHNSALFFFCLAFANHSTLTHFRCWNESAIRQYLKTSSLFHSSVLPTAKTLHSWQNSTNQVKIFLIEAAFVCTSKYRESLWKLKKNKELMDNKTSGAHTILT